jgi:hypothetical protein
MVIVWLLFVCSYSIKALVASTLVIQVSFDGKKNTNPEMAKETAWYLSYHNFPLSLFFFNLVSISFHLKLHQLFYIGQFCLNVTI